MAQIDAEHKGTTMVRGKANETFTPPRPRGRPTKPNGAPPPKGHNILPPESDSQAWQQLCHHARQYQGSLAAKKDYDAKFRNACKLIRREGGDNRVDEVKLLLLLQTPEGVAEFEQRLGTEARIAAWNQHFKGMQGDLFVEGQIAAPSPATLPDFPFEGEEPPEFDAEFGEEDPTHRVT